MSQIGDGSDESQDQDFETKGKKNEVVIVQNEEKVIRKDLSALLGESVETEDPVLAMQYESYEHEKKMIIIVQIESAWMLSQIIQQANSD